VTSARLERLAALVEDGAVKVHIDETFSLDRALPFAEKRRI
jgi:hypothetical protein